MSVSSKPHPYPVELDMLYPGVRVRINSKDWYDKLKNPIGYIYSKDPHYSNFSLIMAKHCGQVMTVEHVKPEYFKGVVRHKIYFKEDQRHYYTINMLESIVPE